MYCTKCGKEIASTAAFCRFCGAAMSAPQAEQSAPTEQAQPIQQAPPAYIPVQPTQQAPEKPINKKAVIFFSTLAAMLVLGLSIGIPVSVSSKNKQNYNNYNNYGNYGGFGENYGQNYGGNTGGNYGGNTAAVCGVCNGTGSCMICGGSHICTICYGRGGLSVTTYGQGGTNWVTCEGCHGTGTCSQCRNGSCDYCSGTGLA